MFIKLTKKILFYHFNYLAQYSIEVKRAKWGIQITGRCYQS